MHAHQRRVPRGDLSVHVQASVSQVADPGGDLAVFFHGQEIGLDLHGRRLRPPGDLRRLAGHRRFDRKVDEIIVHQDRSNTSRSAPRSFRLVEQAVVDQDVARHSADAGRRDLPRQLLQTRERIGAVSCVSRAPLA